MLLVKTITVKTVDKDGTTLSSKQEPYKFRPKGGYVHKSPYEFVKILDHDMNISDPINKKLEERKSHWGEKSYATICSNKKFSWPEFKRRVRMAWLETNRIHGYFVMHDVTVIGQFDIHEIDNIRNFERIEVSPTGGITKFWIKYEKGKPSNITIYDLIVGRVE